MPKIIRVGEYKDYTLIENACLRDMSLDIAERGLLVTMLSLPDSWDFSGIGLTSILPCGKSKVFNTLKKLEDAGYLKRQRIYENGKVADWEYQICGRPIFKNTDKTNNVDNSTNGIDNTENNVDNYVDNSSENVDNSPCTSTDKTNNVTLLPENQEVGFQEEEKQELEKQDIENRYDNIIYTNQISKNQLYKNQTIHQSNSSSDGLTDGLKHTHSQQKAAEREKSKAKAKDYKTYLEIIRDNIEYDILSQRVGIGDIEMLDEIVQIMAETVAFNENYIRINNNEMPAEIVKSRFLKTTCEEIEYVMDMFSKNYSKIYNVRAYLISMIYNAKNTISSYYKAEVQHDLYGWKGRD